MKQLNYLRIDVKWLKHWALHDKQLVYIVRNQRKIYQTTGYCKLSISFQTNRFSHLVTDREGFALRKFYCYQDAKQFINNKPEYMVKKIKFDLGKIEECLF